MRPYSIRHKHRWRSGTARSVVQPVAQTADTRSDKCPRHARNGVQKDNRRANAPGLAAVQESGKAALALKWDPELNAKALSCRGWPALRKVQQSAQIRRPCPRT